MNDDKADEYLSQASDEEPHTAGAPAEGAPAEEARDDEVPEGEPPEVEPLPEQVRSEPGTEVSDDLWNRRSTFFRATNRTGSPVEGQAFEPGRRWTTSEADRQIRAFLMRLAGDRRLAHRTDPTELVRENDLLLLFGPEEEEAFAKLALRFPDETVAQWATLLSGGDRSEAFGPRSRAERRDEAVIARDLTRGLRKRVAGTALLLVVVAVGVLGGRSLLETTPGDRTDRSLRFSTAQGQGGGEDPGDVRLVGGDPVADPSLVAVAETVVAVLRGDGPLEERIMLSVPRPELPIRPGTLAATVFEHGGGQVALVGPDGWVDRACIRVSVVTGRFRPLDTVLHMGSDATCPAGLVGRRAEVTCLGSAALVLAINIPQGEVSLIEGGTGWAEAVRFGVESPVAPSGRWETLAVRGMIAVPVGAESVAVPSFGGGPGDELVMDLGADGRGRHQATCTLS